jgi:hypothetical protein
MEPWQELLHRLLPILQPTLDDPQTRWVLIGSAATALHGCEVTPRDLDFLTAHPAGVHRFVELLHSFLPKTCTHTVDPPDWLSSTSQPISQGPDEFGYIWHFARWRIDGLKVEVAHIVPPGDFRTSKDGAGIWEAGPEIWPHITTVTLGSLPVPVVPLELQLGTGMRRGLDDRVAAISRVLRRRPHDVELLRRSLTSEQLTRFHASTVDSGDTVHIS